MYKKILIYGENWDGTLPNLLSNELALSGHSVTVFDWTELIPGIRTRTFFQKICRRLFIFFYIMRIRISLIARVNQYKPDLIIVSKGLYLDRNIILSFKVKGIKVFNWNPDDFLNKKNNSSYLLEAFSVYTGIISARPHLFDEYREMGATNLFEVDWYYHANLHRKRGLNIQRNISFVGSWSPFREEFISKINYRVEIWGGGWENSKKSFRQKHTVHKTILNQVDMSSIFESSKFNLNLLTVENRDLSNLRFFEVPASGGLLLTPRNSHAESILMDLKECLMFDDVDEINDILSQDSLDLGAIRQSGYLKITSLGCDFSSRVRMIENFFIN